MSDLQRIKLGDLYREAVRLSHIARAEANAATTAFAAGHPLSAAHALEKAAAHAIEAARCLEQLARAFNDERDDVLEPEVN